MARNPKNPGQSAVVKSYVSRQSGRSKIQSLTFGSGAHPTNGVPMFSTRQCCPPKASRRTKTHLYNDTMTVVTQFSMIFLFHICPIHTHLTEADLITAVPVCLFNIYEGGGYSFS